jgi:hypothetical protein
MSGEWHRDGETTTSDLQVLSLLDVLGFETLFQKCGLKQLTERYAELTNYVREQTGGVDVVPLPDGHVAVGWLVVENAYFSDTLLFWTRYNRASLPSFTQLIAEAICYGLERELPLRGTISVGEAILDNDSGIYLGQPIIEAARTEQTQQWIGVSFGPSFMSPEFNKGFYLNTLLPYTNHYKDSDRGSHLATGMTIDWPRRWRETRQTDVRNYISSLDTDSRFSVYYAKTLAFVDFSERNHDWFKKEGHLDYG